MLGTKLGHAFSIPSTVGNGVTYTNGFNRLVHLTLQFIDQLNPCFGRIYAFA